MTPIHGFRNVPAAAELKPNPFTISVSAERLDLLKTLVKHAYIPPVTYESSGAVPELGLTHAWLSNAKTEWTEEFDWRVQEERFNEFPHYKVRLSDGFEMHFMALFSDRADAIPIVFLHGWPGSFLEFLGVFGLLAERYTPETLPYHVVVPSLPGWGFSSRPPVDREFDTDDAADKINQLMVGLGFSSGYMTQGGDIGSYLSRRLAHSYPACEAIHLNFSIMPEPEGIDGSKVTAEESKGLERAQVFYKSGIAYALEHGTKPSTIGLVLSSSPLAFLAWIAEKYLSWSDEPHLSTTEILTTASLYFLTDTISTSIYTYRHEQDKGHAKEDWRVPAGKPFGYSWFHQELAPMPVAWVDRTAEDGLQWYRRHDKGGHFAAHEQPELLLGDVEDFVKECWKS